VIIIQRCQPLEARTLKTESKAPTSAKKINKNGAFRHFKDSQIGHVPARISHVKDLLSRECPAQANQSTILFEYPADFRRAGLGQLNDEELFPYPAAQAASELFDLDKPSS
jgi:hypothetical protein